MGTKEESGSQAASVLADEQARQGRIRSGTQRINSIFDGGVTGAGALGAGAVYDPNAQYFNADGSLWTPTTPSPVAAGTTPAPSYGGGTAGTVDETGGGYGGPVAGGGQKTAQQQFAEMLSKDGLYSGSQRSTGFGDSYFKNRRDAFVNYATPELESQYADAQKQLTFALARGGNLDSSTRGTKAGELQKLYDTNKQGIADKALSYETQARTAVEGARADLIGTLNATGDAEGAAQSALARSTALSQPVAFDPVSQLFANFTGTLGAQAAQERAAVASGGSYTPKYNTGLFGGGGRVSVT